MATTLSLNAVTNKLKGELGYKGLVFTDALNMKGVSSFYKPGEVELKAPILNLGNEYLYIGSFSDEEVIEFDLKVADITLNGKSINLLNVELLIFFDLFVFDFELFFYLELSPYEHESLILLK